MSVVGAKPRMTAPHSGLASAIWTAKQSGDNAEHRDDEGFEIAEAEALQQQHHEDVERGQQHADFERNAEQAD